MTVLLSYPRSGNTWLRYCIEFLSKKPTAIPGSKHPGGNPICEVIPNMGVDIKAAPICGKSHNILDLNKKARVIVLVRDYKEAVVRHYKMISTDTQAFKERFLLETAGQSRNGVDYIKILEYFDKLKGERLLVYYEDLILSPRKTIIKVIDFLNVNHTYVDGFFNNYNFHHQQGLRSYHGGSFTKGEKNSLKTHQLSIPPELLSEMTDSIKKRHKHIFNKYLKRYE